MDVECLDPMENLKFVPKCAKCRNHNIIVPRKGHKSTCPWFNCSCVKCTTTAVKRDVARQRKSRKDIDHLPSDQHEEDVHLLLNLNMDCNSRKRKETELVTASKRNYRFSGTIQNNVFFPADMAVAGHPAPPTVMVLTTNKDFGAGPSPGEFFEETTTGTFEEISLQQLCTDHVEWFHPPAQQSQGYPSTEVHHPMLTHHQTMPSMPAHNGTTGQVTPTPDMWWTTPGWSSGYLLPTSQDVVSMTCQYHPPSPSVRYPFSANAVLQKMANVKFMPR